MKQGITSRIRYLLATILLFFIEVGIALFTEDGIVRSYIGDVLVIILIYTFIRIIIPERGRGLPIFIFLFAVSVELLQYIHIVELIGLDNNRFIRTLIGTVFDFKDIISYLIGTLLLVGYEFLLVRNKRKKDRRDKYER